MPDQPIYQYVPHSRTMTKLEGLLDKPVKVAEQLPHATAPARFERGFAVKITNGVGTMWCAYAFAVLALISLPRPSSRTAL